MPYLDCTEIIHSKKLRNTIGVLLSLNMPYFRYIPQNPKEILKKTYYTDYQIKS